MTDSLISAARAEQGSYDTTYLDTFDAHPPLGSGASSDHDEDAAPNSHYNSNYGNKSSSPQSHSSLEDINQPTSSGRRHTSTGITDSGLKSSSSRHHRRRRSSEQRSSEHTSDESEEGGTSGGSGRKRGGSSSGSGSSKKKKKKKLRTQSEPAVPNINPFETGGPSDDLLEDFFGLGTTTTNNTTTASQPATNNVQLQQQPSFDVAFDPNHDPFAPSNDTNIAQDPLFDLFGLDSSTTNNTTVTSTAPQLPTSTIPTPQSGRRGSRNIEQQLEPGAPQRKRRGSKQHKKKKKRRRKASDDSDDNSEHTSGESTHTSGNSSDSSSGSMSDLSDEELQKHRDAYRAATGGMKFTSEGAPDAIPPPPGRQRSKRGGKARASAPAGDIGRDLDRMRSDESIPERQFGVNVGDKDTDRRVRTHIREKDRERNKSTDSNSGTNTTSKPPSKDAPPPPKTKSHDVLPEIKRGTALLKYGRRGYPHFRQFNISSDNRYLVWFSNKKKLDTSSINVRDIDEVITGQHTKEFRRIAWTTLTPASFSIIYDGKKRSLNLVAKSVDEMKMWVQALRALRDKARKGEQLEGMRELKIEVDFRDRNRPQSRKHSGNFLRSHETKEREVDPILHRRLIDDLDALKKQFQELTLLTQNEVLRSAGEEWKSIEQILSELEERIEELEHEVINTRNTKIAENDVWRTRIDMEALKEKIKVLIKTNKKKYKQDKSRRWSVF